MLLGSPSPAMPGDARHDVAFVVLVVQIALLGIVQGLADTATEHAAINRSVFLTLQG